MPTPAEHHLEYRVVQRTAVEITRLDWPDGGVSYEVYRADNGTCLTMDGAFDTIPDDNQIAELITNAPAPWTCPGCHAPVDPDYVTDHVRDCDRVNGAAQPTST